MELARLKLLCRETRAWPAEVLQLVQTYLVLRMSWYYPFWLPLLFVDRIMALPRCARRFRSIMIDVVASVRIDYAEYRQDPIVYDMVPLRAPEAGQAVTVQVRLQTIFKPRNHNCWPRASWEMECWQGTELLRRASNIRREIGADTLSALYSIRRCFTDLPPRGHMEVPMTWQSWRMYIQLFLSGSSEAADARIALCCRQCLMA